MLKLDLYDFLGKILLKGSWAKWGKNWVQSKVFQGVVKNHWVGFF